MTQIISALAISRRKALTLLGLATAAFAASSVVVAPDAEAQTAVWSAVRKDAEAVRTGVRRGALAARRDVKKGASESFPDALARVRTEDPYPRGFQLPGATRLV